MKFLQKLGKALMLPVACLPICGILMGIGYALCPATEGTEKVDYTVYIWYNVSIKYRRCFYDRTTAEIDAKSIHGNI